jgi:hypothetical protein
MREEVYICHRVPVYNREQEGREQASQLLRAVTNSVFFGQKILQRFSYQDSS